MLMTKEHYDLMGQFEREHRGRRMDRESKELWPRGIIYQDGHVNELFAAYRRGYAFAVADYRSDLQNLEASRDGYRRDAERLQTEIDTLKSSKAEQSEEGTPPASAQDDAKDEQNRHKINADLCAFYMRWEADGDYLRCRKCKRPQIASYAEKNFPHAAGCKAVGHVEQRPWLALVDLLRPLIGPAPAAGDAETKS